MAFHVCDGLIYLSFSHVLEQDIPRPLHPLLLLDALLIHRNLAPLCSTMPHIWLSPPRPNNIARIHILDIVALLGTNAVEMGLVWKVSVWLVLVAVFSIDQHVQLRERRRKELFQRFHFGNGLYS